MARSMQPCEDVSHERAKQKEQQVQRPWGALCSEKSPEPEGWSRMRGELGWAARANYLGPGRLF